MNIKFVQQESGNDCVLACVAMITGETIKDMHKKYNVILPMSDEDAIKILALNGFVCEKQLDTKIKPGNVYLVTVPSLNLPKINHLIIFNTRTGFKIYDPNFGRKDKLHYTNLDGGKMSWGDVIRVIDARDILKEIPK